MTQWSRIIFTTLALFLCLGTPASADHSILRSDTQSTLPDFATGAGLANSQTFWDHEIPLHLGDHLGPFIFSGGIHSESSNFTSASFTTVAYVPERVNQTATTIAYDSDGSAIANDVCWTIISSDNNGISGWSRVGTTAYYVQCEGDTTPTEPVTPPNSAKLMRLTITDSAIATVTDLRKFRTPLAGIPAESFESFVAAIDEFNDTGDPNVTITVSSRMHVRSSVTVSTNIVLAVSRGGTMVVDSGITLTLPCDNIEAGNYRIFMESGTVTCSDVPSALRIAWFDSTTDESVQIQEAIDALPSGGGRIVGERFATYSLVEKTGGGTDQFAVQINNNKITLDCNDSTIKRSAASAYSTLFIGVPDSNSIQIDGVKIENCIFDGDDILHSVAGSSPLDFRSQIMLRNTRNTTIRHNKFEDVDSSAIYAMSPLNAVAGNLISVFNEKVKIHDNTFECTEHSIAGRALIHAVHIAEINGAIVENNHFEWCDVAVVGGGTYEDAFDIDGSTYTHAVLGAGTSRAGRGWVVNDNTIYNSSEHALYLSGMGMAVQGNTVWTGNPSICIGDIKFDGQELTISGNVVTARTSTITLDGLVKNVAITGNALTSLQAGPAGSIGVEVHGVSAFIDARPFLTTFMQWRNISITGNSIAYAGNTPSSGTDNDVSIGIRIFTDSSDANYQSAGNQHQLVGLNITGNTFYHQTHTIAILGILAKGIAVTGNTFWGQPLPVTEANHTDNTDALVSQYVITVNNLSSMQDRLLFSNNYVYGFEALFGLLPDQSALINLYPPNVFTGNIIVHVDAFDNSNFRAYRQEATLIASGNSFQSFFGTEPTQTPAITITQANLPAVVNGTIVYCSDCNPDATCTSGGSGALGVRIQSAWNCELN